MIKVTNIYTTSDNRQFTDESEAVKHEEVLQKDYKNAYERFSTSLEYQNLLKHHTLDEEAIWVIHGCNERNIGYAEGKLNDAILYAVTLTKWSDWGHGGRIDKLETVKVGG